MKNVMYINILLYIYRPSVILCVYNRHLVFIFFFLDAMQISFNLYNQPAKPLLAVLTSQEFYPQSTLPPLKDSALQS